MAEAGRWTRIQNFVNRHLPVSAAAFVKLRGLSFPLDPFLTGQTRFARKIGEILPLIQPDNASDLVADILDSGKTAILDEPIKWIVRGSLIRFPVSGDMAEVDDISSDSQTVHFVNPTVSNHVATERMELFAHPITFTEIAGSQPLPPIQSGSAASITLLSIGNRVVVSGLTGMTPDSTGHQLLITGAASSTNNGTFEITQFLSPDSVIIASPVPVTPDANNGAINWVEAYPIYSLESSLPIYGGDELWLQYVSYDVIRSVIVGPVPPDDTRYLVTLSRVLTSVPQVGGRLYLRAYPAYESAILPIPEIPFSTRSVGPGLLDWMSGPLFEDLLVDEVQNYRVFDSSFSPIGEYEPIDKNFFETRLAIDPDTFMFFRPTRGEINWNGRQFIAKADERREFHTFFDLTPELPNGYVSAWTTQVVADVDTHLIIELEDSARQAYDLVAGVERTIRINHPKPAFRMHIAFSSVAPGGTVKMRNWVPFNVSRVAAVQHVLIGKVTGRYDWAATALFYKPYWLSLEYLKVRSDVRGGLDSGLLVL